MKEPTRSEYTQIYLQLLEFFNKVGKAWAQCDLETLQSCLDNIRWYRQFTREEKKREKVKPSLFKMIRNIKP